MTPPLKTSSAGVDLIKSFEKCKLKAYRDPVGIWTVGWGDTGPDVHEGMEISQEDADSRLARKLASFEDAVNKAVTVPLSQHQFDALLCFTYNCGAEALRMSKLLRLLNAGQYADAADQFLRWNHAGGEVLAGLTRRREAERALFLS